MKHTTFTLTVLLAFADLAGGSARADNVPAPALNPASNPPERSLLATGVATLAITSQPSSQSAAVGSTVTFSVSATAASAVNYQWRKDGANITGNTSANTARLSLPNVRTTSQGTYDVVVSNSSGVVVSRPALLTVTNATPVITSSPLSAAATVNTPFNFTIAASGAPMSHSASPLPAGLSIAAATGAITGTPTSVGTTFILLGATNTSGTGHATLTITVAAPGGAPVIMNNPLTAGGTINTPFSFTITASGSPFSYSANPLPAGLNMVPDTGAIIGTPTAVGTTSIILSAMNSTGSGSAMLTITIAAAGVAPVITNNPLSAAATVGTPFSFIIAAAGSPVSFHAVQLPADLIHVPTTGVITGIPTIPGRTTSIISATNAHGTSTAELTIEVAGEAVAPSSRIVNFSARALSGAGDQALITGFVIAGDGKKLLVRGVGPGLTPHGVLNVLADPMLTLFNSSASLGSNDDWQTPLSGQASGAAIAATAARVGAFALPEASKDSALLAVFNNGAHTTSMVRPNSTTGVALTEIYDTDAASTARLINVSVRMDVAAGEGALMAGVVIAGDVPKTVLIRGVGPSLSGFGVTSVLADPRITVYFGALEVASNDNWETGASTREEMNVAFARVGAFALVGGSRDAALLATLAPGNYTVQVTSVGSTTGIALIEIYDTQ